MNEKKPIDNLIVKLLSIYEHNVILRWIDLEANGSVDKSKIGNINSCIEGIAKNSPIDRMNVRECFFGDNSFHKEAPNLFNSDHFCRFGLFRLFSERTGFDWRLLIELCLDLILPRFIPARYFSVPTSLAKIRIKFAFITPGGGIFAAEWITAMTGAYL